MSQYNPKFFSREHISSIAEALNQVLNGGTNSTHATHLTESGTATPPTTTKAAPANPIEWRPGMTDVKSVDDATLAKYARMPKEYGEKASASTAELARRKELKGSGKLIHMGLEFHELEDRTLDDIMKKEVKNKGLFDRGSGAKDDADQTPAYLAARNLKAARAQEKAQKTPKTSDALITKPLDAPLTPRGYGSKPGSLVDTITNMGGKQKPDTILPDLSKPSAVDNMAPTYPVNPQRALTPPPPQRFDQRNPPDLRRRDPNLPSIKDAVKPGWLRDNA